MDVQQSILHLNLHAQGEFIFAKYVLFCMRLLRDSWEPEDVEALLPEGLGGAYWLIMKVGGFLPEGLRGPIEY